MGGDGGPVFVDNRHGRIEVQTLSYPLHPLREDSFLRIQERFGVKSPDRFDIGPPTKQERAHQLVVNPFLRLLGIPEAEPLRLFLAGQKRGGEIYPYIFVP